MRGEKKVFLKKDYRRIVYSFKKKKKKKSKEKDLYARQRRVTTGTGNF